MSRLRARAPRRPHGCAPGGVPSEAGGSGRGALAGIGGWCRPLAHAVRARAGRRCWSLLPALLPTLAAGSQPRAAGAPMDSHVRGGFCPGVKSLLCTGCPLLGVHVECTPLHSWCPLGGPPTSGFLVTNPPVQPPRSLTTRPIWQQLPVTQRRSVPWTPLTHIRAKRTAEVLPLEKAPLLCPGPPRAGLWGCPLVDGTSRPGRPICQPGSASALP